MSAQPTPREKLEATWKATTTDRTRIVKYLHESRGLPDNVIDDVPNEVLQFAPALPYHQDGHLGDYPCMVTKVTDVSGTGVTLHRTYFAPDGPGKLDLGEDYPAKKLMTATQNGATKGASIKLWLARSVLGLAEGIETALAVHAATGQHVWSTVSAGGMEAVIVPDVVKTVHIWADHDESGVGQQKAEELAQRLRDEGRTVYVHTPPETGQDWLDAYVKDGAERLLSELAECAEWKPSAREPDAPGLDDDDGDTSAELSRLAALDTLAYERERKTVAAALGIRASVLDEVIRARRQVQQPSDGGLFLKDPEPWPEPVDGAELLDELGATAKRYVSMPAGAPEVVALWVVHAHSHAAAEVSALLAVTSPTPECGKTVLLTLLQALVPRQVTGSNITAASLFRVVEKYRPTLLIDEADTFLRDNDDLRGVLDSGHTRAGAYVVRTVGEQHEPAVFRTWAPKAIALIGKLPATLASRSIHVELKRLAPGERVVPLRLHQLDALLPLRRRTARWAADHLEELRVFEPEIPPTLYGRAADNWRSLLAIADIAGGEWPQRARQAAVTLSATAGEQTAGILLLEDVRQLFRDRGDRLATADILAALNDMDARPWPEWSRGRELTAHGLGKLLSPFGITSRTIRLGSTPNSTPKGYLEEQFVDTFARYLPPCVSATPPQPAVRAENSPSLSATPSDLVADTKPRKPAVNATCGGVADRDPLPPPERDSEPETEAAEGSEVKVTI